MTIKSIGRLLVLVGLVSGVTLTLKGTQPVLAHESQPKSIVLIGGSAALGDGDSGPVKGYFTRAIDILTKQEMALTFDNQSQSGLTTAEGTPLLAKYLATHHPDIVILGYGLLDDLESHESEDAFEQHIRDQIALARKSGAEVIVSAPAPTVSSLTNDLYRIQIFIMDEFIVADEFRDNQVQCIDTYDEMKDFVEWHNIDIHTLAYDSWHPNAAGHAMAARYLARDLADIIGPSAVTGGDSQVNLP